MPTYHLKLRDFETDVYVPSDVKGLRAVADYICRDQARRFANARVYVEPKATYERRLKNAEENWYDSHIDVITELLTDLKYKLRANHG